MVMSFLLGDLRMYCALSAASRSLRRSAWSLNAWRGACIAVPRVAAARLDVASRWQLAKEAVLPAVEGRKWFQKHLETHCPELTLRLKGEGPLMLFVMACHLSVGSHVALHFFEPRRCRPKGYLEPISRILWRCLSLKTSRSRQLIGYFMIFYVVSLWFTVIS